MDIDKAEVEMRDAIIDGFNENQLREALKDLLDKHLGKTLIGICGDCQYWIQDHRNLGRKDYGLCEKRRQDYMSNDGCIHWKEKSCQKE